MVSQGVGVAIGLQDRFSFKQVAMAGISAAAGFGAARVLGQAGVAGSKVLTDAVRGAAGSAISQGVGVALGLQKKFDFAGVAAAGLGAAVGGIASRSLETKLDQFGKPYTVPSTWNTRGEFGHIAAVSMADALGQAAARSIVQGTSFGDNLMAALPSAIGNTIGNAIGEGVKRSVEATETRQAKEAYAAQVVAAKEAEAADAKLRTLYRYSGPAIQMDLADHLLTSSHGSRGLSGALYRSEIRQLIESGRMRDAMAIEIRDVRRTAVEGGGSITKYNQAIREMLDYTYRRDWLTRWWMLTLTRP